MSIKDLVPRIRGEQAPLRRSGENDVFSFQRRMNRLFNEFFSDFGLTPGWESGESGHEMFVPRVNLSETEKDVVLSAEMPGMDEKDLTVEVDEECVHLGGEKKYEQEDKGRSWHRREYGYGTFSRVIQLPARVDAGKAKARFKNGVLSLTLPKREEEHRKRRSVEIVNG